MNKRDILQQIKTLIEKLNIRLQLLEMDNKGDLIEADLLIDDIKSLYIKAQNVRDCIANRPANADISNTPHQKIHRATKPTLALHAEAENQQSNTKQPDDSPEDFSSQVLKTEKKETPDQTQVKQPVSPDSTNNQLINDPITNSQESKIIPNPPIDVTSTSFITEEQDKIDIPNTPSKSSVTSSSSPNQDMIQHSHETAPLSNTIGESQNTMQHKTDEQSTHQLIGEKYQNQSTSLNDLLSKTQKVSSIGEQMQYQRIDNLTHAIALNEKICFIRDLFQSDNQAYKSAIESFNTAASLQQALTHFEELSIRFTWNKHQQASDRLAEYVYRRHAK